MGKVYVTRFSELVSRRTKGSAEIQLAGYGQQTRRDFARLVRKVLNTSDLVAGNILVSSDIFELLTVVKGHGKNTVNEHFCPHYHLVFRNNTKLAALYAVYQKMGVRFPLDCCEDELKRYDIGLKTVAMRSFSFVTHYYRSLQTYIAECLADPGNTKTEEQLGIQWWLKMPFSKETRTRLECITKMKDREITYLYENDQGFMVVANPILLKMVYRLRGSRCDYKDHGFRDNLMDAQTHLTGLAEFKDKVFTKLSEAWEWAKKKIHDLWTVVSGYIQGIYSSPTVSTIKGYLDTVLNPVKTFLEWMWTKVGSLTKKFLFGFLLGLVAAILSLVGFKLAGYLGRFAVSMLASMGVEIPDYVKFFLSANDQVTDWETSRTDQVEEEMRIAFALFFHGTRTKNELVERLRKINPADPYRFEFIVCLAEKISRDQADDILEIMSSWERTSLFNREDSMKARVFDSLKDRVRKVVINDFEIGRTGWKSAYADIVDKQLAEVEIDGHCSSCKFEEDRWIMTKKCLHRDGVQLHGPPIQAIAASGFMTGLVGAAITGTWPSRDDTKKTLSFLRTYGGFAAIGTGAAGLGAILCSLWPKLVGYFVAQRFFPASIMESQVSRFVDRCELLFKASHSAEALTTASFRRGVELCCEEAHQLYRNTVLDHQSKRVIGIYHTKLMAILPSTYAADFIRQDRMSPFVIHLYGDPGKGKTLTMKAFSKCFPPHLTYNKPVRGEHWNGVSPQHKYVFWDEFLMHDPDSTQTMDFLSLASTGIFMPELASLDNPSVGIKGTHVRPDMVFLASNHGWPSSNVPRDAIYRRRNLLVEVAVANGAPLTIEGKLDLSKASVEELNTLPFIRYRIRNTMSNEGVAGEWMNLDSLMGIIATQFEEWKATNVRIAGSRACVERNAFEKAWEDMEHAFSNSVLCGGVSTTEWLTSKNLLPSGNEPKSGAPVLVCRDKSSMSVVKSIFDKVGLDFETRALEFFHDQHAAITSLAKTDINLLKTQYDEATYFQCVLMHLAKHVPTSRSYKTWKGFCSAVLSREEKNAKGLSIDGYSSDDSSTTFDDAVEKLWDEKELEAMDLQTLIRRFTCEWADFSSSTLEEMYAIVSKILVNQCIVDSVNGMPSTRTAALNTLKKLDAIRKRAFVKKMGVDVVSSPYHRIMLQKLEGPAKTWYSVNTPPKLDYTDYENEPKIDKSLPPTDVKSGFSAFLSVIVKDTSTGPPVIPSFGILETSPKYTFTKMAAVAAALTGLSTVFYLIYRYFNKEEEIPATSEEIDAIYGVSLTSKPRKKVPSDFTPYDREGWSRQVNMRKVGKGQLTGPTEPTEPPTIDFASLAGPAAVKKAVCQISFDKDSMMYAICLGDNYFLCNAHFFADYDQGAFKIEHDHLWVKFVGETSWTKCSLDTERMVVNEMYDIAVFRLSPAATCFRGSVIKLESVVDSFIVDSDIQKIGYTSVMVIGEKDNTSASFARIQKDVDPIRVKKWVVAPGTVLHAMNLHSVQGDCGRPWMITSGECLHKIAAIHMAATNCGTSYGAFVTQEVLKGAISSLQNEDQDPILTGPGGVRGPNVVQWRTLRFNERVHVPHVTKITESPLSEFLVEQGFEPEKAPAPLVGGDHRVEPEYRENPALMAFNQRLEAKVPPADKRTLELSRRQMKRYLKENLTWPIEPRILTTQEAISGVPGKLASVTMASSPGWPLLKQSDKPGKRSFLEQEFDGENFHWKPTPALLEELDVYEEYLLDPENVEKPDVRWLMYTKDELRVHDKIKKGKVRLTACGPLALWVKAREMAGSFMAAVNFSWKTTGYAVGCNPNSWDMHFILDRLTVYNEELFAGDGKDWDITLHRQFIDAALQTIGEILQERIPDFNIKKFARICNLIVDSPMQFQAWLVWIEHGQRSGNIFTTIMNCMIHDMYWRYAFLKLCPHLRYDDYVRATFCGDDVLVAVKPEILEEFNDLLYSIEIAKIGQTYTSDDKKSALTGTPRKLKDVTFLGCHPRRYKTPNMWYGALRQSSIWDLFYWMERGGDWVLRLKQGVKFMSGWGESDFNDCVNTLHRVVTQLESCSWWNYCEPGIKYQCEEAISFLRNADYDLIQSEIVTETTFNRVNWLWSWVLCNGQPTEFERRIDLVQRVRATPDSGGYRALCL